MLLLNNGIKITDEQILELVSKELQNAKSKRLAGTKDVQNKFKSAMDEYLERISKY